MRRDLETSIKRAHKKILKGSLLAIDPSIGSRSSAPGYALFVDGELTDYGTLEIPKPTRKMEYKLQDLRQILMDVFDTPDVLAVERIPPKRYIPGGFNPVQTSLLAAEAVILSAFDCKYVIRIKPSEWQAISKKTGHWSREKKDDDMDAYGIGMAAITISKEMADGLWVSKPKGKRGRPKSSRSAPVGEACE